MAPKVSMVMAVHNEEKYLQAAVDSILGQTFTDFEFIIVDDASTDNTPRILDSYDDPRLICIRLTQRQGSAAARNEALHQARGEYVGIQDADDLSFSERLACQVAYLDEHPQVGLVGSAIVITDEQGVPTQKEILHQAVRKSHFCHGSIMFRRICLEQSGYYRSFFQRSQDRDLMQRIAQHFETVKLPQVLYQYRLVASKRTVPKVILQCRYDLLVKEANQKPNLMNNELALRAVGELRLRPHFLSAQWWHGRLYISKCCRYYGKLFFRQRKYGLALQHFAASLFFSPHDALGLRPLIRFFQVKK